MKYLSSLFLIVFAIAGSFYTAYILLCLLHWYGVFPQATYMFSFGVVLCYGLIFNKPFSAAEKLWDAYQKDNPTHTEEVSVKIAHYISTIFGISVFWGIAYLIKVWILN